MPPPAPQSEETPPDFRRPFGRRLKVFVLRTVVVVLAGLLLLVVALQLPWVQNRLVDELATFFSEEMGATVRIDRVDIEFFDGLELEGFYLEDADGDTLLYAQSLVSEFNTGLRALLQNRLEIEAVTLTGADVYLKRDPTTGNPNFQFLVDYFALPDSVQRRPFYLDANDVYLESIHFRNANVARGATQEVLLDRGHIRFNDIDLPTNRFDIADLELMNPIVRIITQPESDTTLSVVQLVEEVQDLADELATADSNYVAPFFAIDDLTILNGQLILHNYRKEPVPLTSKGVLNFNHLEVFDINVAAQHLESSGGELTGRVEEIAARAASGFVLERLAAEELRVDARRIEANGLELITPDTHLGDTLVFKFRDWADWADFNDRVLMDLRFAPNSFVQLGDIVTFAKGLDANPFFAANREQTLQLSGRVSGRVNNLRGRDLSVRIGDRLVFEGNFSSRDLAVPESQALNLRVDRLQTSMTTLRQIIPNFNLPPNFDKFGRFSFDGNFDGFFVDFVAYGNLRTQLGNLRVDLRLDTKRGRRDARYSGAVALQNFDLATWSENPQFGTVSLTANVRNGVGLVAETANADLEARVTEFTFRNYTYRDFLVNGQLNRNLFDGTFEIQEPNVDFNFAGRVDFSGQIPRFDFTADIHDLDLNALRLSNQQFALAGKLDIDVVGIDPSNLRGHVALGDLAITRGDTVTFRIDTLDAYASGDTTNRSLYVESDVLEAKIEGAFDVERVVPAFKQYFAKNFPGYAERLSLVPTERYVSPQQLEFFIKIFDKPDLLPLVSPQLRQVAGANLVGKFDSAREEFEFQLLTDSTTVGGVQLKDIAVIMEGDAEEGNLDVAVGQTWLNGAKRLDDITVFTVLNRDTVTFGITNRDYSSRGDYVQLNGFGYPVDNDFFIRFSQSDISLLGEDWVIEPDNYVRIGKGRLETRDFRLRSGNRRIVLESIGERGLELRLRNIELEPINDIWIYPILHLTGRVDVTVQSRDVFDQTGLSVSVGIDTLDINGDDWGRLSLEASAADLKSRLDAYLTITSPKADGRQLRAEGFFNLPGYQGGTGAERPAPNQLGNYLDFQLELQNFPADIVEYWVPDGITGTVGTVDGNLRVFGPPSRIESSGTAYGRDIETTINYLGTTYRIPEGEVRINNTLFDATGVRVYDRFGNVATVKGGLTHQYLKNLGLGATLSSQNFLFLETGPDDNPVYYGTGIGAGSVTFSNNFRQTDIKVRAVTGPGTVINIPVTYSETAQEVSFIKFKDKNESEPEEEVTPELLGVDVDMSITFTPDAETRIIFDEQAGDIIRGVGTGDVQILFGRGDRELRMFGTYTVEEGDYLFTLLNVVNKPFEVRPGGTIQWRGDPFGAELNLTAEYEGLRTPVFNLVRNYLSTAASPQATADARRATDVELTMYLTGELYEPNIAFDLDFPDLQGELKSYVESQLRVLRRDPNELNRQVFGLVVIGQFFPSSGLTTNDLNLTVNNTVTEMLSQQLSLFLTDLVGNLVKEDGALSGIDLRVNYSQYQLNGVVGDPTTFTTGNEFAVSPRLYFFDDRLILSSSVGSTSVAGNSGTLFAGDLVVEYVLTDDRQLRVRAYQSTEPRINGRRNRTGIGLSYRKEFDSFAELFDSMD